MKGTGTTDKQKAQEYHDKLKAQLWDETKLGIKPSDTWNAAEPSGGCPSDGREVACGKTFQEGRYARGLGMVESWLDMSRSERGCFHPSRLSYVQSSSPYLVNFPYFLRFSMADCAKLSDSPSRGAY